MRALRNGMHGSDVKRFQTAIARRARARDAPNHIPEIDGVMGPQTKEDACYVAYLLGMELDALKHMRFGAITPEEQRFILNPGERDQVHLDRAKRRLAAHKKVRAKQKAAAAAAGKKRKRIVAEARKAAANYRKNPGAYHYLAGGKPNNVYLEPTPRSWRSDCSQFAASVYKGAGVDSPAKPLDYLWTSTFTIVKSPHMRIIPKSQRKPGDLGMYGSHDRPHHVEIWCGDAFIGHGSPPIDSLTPGEPDYYVTFDFLDK